jgi:hypothetical protein
VLVEWMGEGMMGGQGCGVVGGWWVVGVGRVVVGRVFTIEYDDRRCHAKQLCPVS